MKTQIGLLVMLVALCSQLAVSQQSKTSNVEIDGVLVTLIDDVEVSVEEPGLISEVKVIAGQVVKAGDLLARTNDQEQQIRKGKAEIELRNSERLAKNKIKIRLAKKAQEVAETEWKRGKESLKRYKKSVSLTEIDRLRLAAERAALDVEQANYDHGTAQLAVDLNRTEVKLADHMTKRRRVVSPISGVVVMVKGKKGEWVKPGEMFVRVVSTKRLQIGRAHV